MDEDVVKKLTDAVRDTAYDNGIDNTQLHAIIDSVVVEVRTNIQDYVDLVCKRWF